jgi:hypothetical protein
MTQTVRRTAAGRELARQVLLLRVGLLAGPVEDRDDRIRRPPTPLGVGREEGLEECRHALIERHAGLALGAPHREQLALQVLDPVGVQHHRRAVGVHLQDADLALSPDQVGPADHGVLAVAGIDVEQLPGAVAERPGPAEQRIGAQRVGRRCQYVQQITQRAGPAHVIAVANEMRLDRCGQRIAAEENPPRHECVAQVLQCVRRLDRISVVGLVERAFRSRRARIDRLRGARSRFSENICAMHG